MTRAERRFAPHCPNIPERCPNYFGLGVGIDWNPQQAVLFSNKPKKLGVLR